MKKFRNITKNKWKKSISIGIITLIALLMVLISILISASMVKSSSAETSEGWAEFHSSQEKSDHRWYSDSNNRRDKIRVRLSSKNTDNCFTYVIYANDENKKNVYGNQYFQYEPDAGLASMGNFALRIWFSSYNGKQRYIRQIYSESNTADLHYFILYEPAPQWVFAYELGSEQWVGFESYQDRIKLRIGFCCCEAGSGQGIVIYAGKNDWLEEVSGMYVEFCGWILNLTSWRRGATFFARVYLWQLV